MKHNTMLKVALILMTMLVVGCGATTETKEESAAMSKFNAAHKGAMAATDKAKSVGGEWRDIRWKKSKAVKVKVKGKDGKVKTKKMSILAAAKAYAKMGDFKKANKLVKKAVFQADRGYQQALEQKNAGPTFN